MTGFGRPEMGASHLRSPLSLAKIADEQHAYHPSYQERIFGRRWQQLEVENDEPEPRKLRVWPVSTVAAGVQCNNGLLELKDESVQDPSEEEIATCKEVRC
jgi:hypothetical protein